MSLHVSAGDSEITALHPELLLARRGFVYREGTPWRQPHYEWLRRLARADSPLAAEDRIVIGEDRALLEYKLSRRDELNRQIAARALTPALAQKVTRLQCFRRLDTHGAMVLATELADWWRLGSARELMAYFQLVPRERSSSERQRRGSITKAGNSYVRHVLVHVAWSYRFATKVGVALKKRQESQAPRVIAHAWKSQHRAHNMFRRLSAARPPQVTARSSRSPVNWSSFCGRDARCARARRGRLVTLVLLV